MHTMTTTPPSNASSQEGTIVCCTSARGGTGKTSVSLLLASAISKFPREDTEDALSVVVVDMDVRDGQIGFLIGQMEPTIIDINTDPSLIQDSVRQNLIYADNLGVHILLAPKRPRRSLGAPLESFRAIIEELRRMFDVVILDTATDYNDLLLRPLCYPIADLIILVTSHSLYTLCDTSRLLREVTNPISENGMSLNKDSIGIVGNKAMSAGDYSDDDRSTRMLKDEGANILGSIPSKPVDFENASNTLRINTLLLDPDIDAAFSSLAEKVVSASARADLFRA
jgi:MinD-like ATPase involved in chromosome partitioning or flagellar assembly